MRDSGEGWRRCPKTGWWDWVGSHEEDSKDGPAAREQQDASAVNCRGSSAVAESSGRSSTSNAAAAGAPPAAIAEQAASYTAVAAHAGVEDTMAAPSSALPDQQGVFHMRCSELFRNSLGTIGNTTRHSSTGDKSLRTARILWAPRYVCSPPARE